MLLIATPNAAPNTTVGIIPYSNFQETNGIGISTDDELFLHDAIAS
ncbi:MAG: hypothetical protein AB8B94_07315 [Hyphomicrobiales bacterium]